MEDSAKRKERLQAMRMEASSSSTDRPSPSFSTPNMPLSNPLIYPSVPSMKSQLSPHRFDYYTDPTTAYFSAGRNMNKKGEDARHDSYHRPPIFSSPIHNTSPPSYTAAQQQFAGQQTEHHMHPANTRAHQVPSPNTPFLRSQSGSLTSPVQYSSPASGDRGAPHHLPKPWNMSGNSSSEHSFTPNSSNGGSQLSFRPMNSPYSGIRGSPHSHSSGRGRGRGGSPYNNQGYGSGRLKKLDSFFIKSMMKDPWRKLKPVVGDILMPLRPLPWLPKSIATKKPKVDETSTDVQPKQNLAEFLALAFEESQEGEGSMLPSANE
ncbi:hypothetical protein KSP39_PZI014311 [Platanthera zijinensis]|uniref:Uncharacterized protein n=1 Tax=Platanthera zijinensis TaxID=2320716 RepID=A0AAP0BA51_9ASPA